MQWSDFIGHQQVIDWFRHAMAKQRVANTFLFVGPDGVGKRTLARLLGKSLLCHQNPHRTLEFCNACESCTQVEASTHPDLLEIQRQEGDSQLSIGIFAGEGENRGKEGLIHELGHKSFYGKGRVAIIDEADYFNEASANCMLKTLEEPPPGVRLFLIGTSLQRQMPTIRSRSQIVRFQGLSIAEMQRLAKRLGVEASEDTLREADGSWTTWKLYNDPKLQEFRLQLYQKLAECPLDFVQLSKSIVSSLDSVAKEGPERRVRLRILLNFVIQFYRMAWMQGASCLSDSVDPRVSECLSKARRSWGSDESIPLQAIHRSLQASSECDRNISAAALMDAWAADLSVICHA